MGPNTWLVAGNDENNHMEKNLGNQLEKLSKLMLMKKGLVGVRILELKYGLTLLNP